ncbi:fascin domain-containing protein [Sorangium sp. So ce388]|uniref:fascin domain-containing protein n=1 Tax=Sorangium sp. So ce388 TaxID=3133309 RepID=UPI003F5BC086
MALTNGLNFSFRASGSTTKFVGRYKVGVDNVQAQKDSIDPFCVFTLLANNDNTYSIQTDNQALWKATDDSSIDAVQDNPNNPSAACRFSLTQGDSSTQYVIQSFTAQGYVQVQSNGDLFATADSTSSATQFELIPLTLPLSKL